jgi:hypothetical protein
MLAGNVNCLHEAREFFREKPSSSYGIIKCITEIMRGTNCNNLIKQSAENQ